MEKDADSHQNSEYLISSKVKYAQVNSDRTECYLDRLDRRNYDFELSAPRQPPAEFWLWSIESLDIEPEMLLKSDRIYQPPLS
jgi:hypothetical protein